MPEKKKSNLGRFTNNSMTCTYLGTIIRKQYSLGKNTLKTLKKTTTLKLNIIKSISSQRWGSDRSTLIKTYNSLILPALDYGAIIYNSASKPLNILNSIHNQGIRLEIRAFFTSPIDSIICEAGQQLLWIRRIKKILKYYLKNPAHKAIFPTNPLHFIRPRDPKLILYSKLKEYSKDIDIWYRLI